MQESACLIPIYLLEKHLVAFGHSDIISSCDYSQYEIGSDKVSVVVLSFSYPCIYWMDRMHKEWKKLYVFFFKMFLECK